MGRYTSVHSLKKFKYTSVGHKKIRRSLLGGEGGFNLKKEVSRWVQI